MPKHFRPKDARKQGRRQRPAEAQTHRQPVTIQQDPAAIAADLRDQGNPTRIPQGKPRRRGRR